MNNSFKRKFHKKRWSWIIAIILVIGVVTSGGIKGETMIKTNAETLKKQSGTFSILEYGADTNKSANENTTSIQNAINAMAKGSTLIIPNGDFNINNLVYAPADDCTLVCNGTLVSSTAGTAFKIGDPSKSIQRQKIDNLKVKSITRDITEGRIGIEIINSYSGKYEIDFVNGFEKNIQVRGTNNIGSSYNEFRLGDIQDGKKSIFLTADNGGWCNENNFYGGHLSFTTAITDYTDCVHITINRNDEHALNNNHFYSPSLETRSLVSLAMVIEGNNNSILYPRLEATGQILWKNAVQLTEVSQNNTLMYGYGFFLSCLQDSGKYNKIFAGDGLILNGNSDVNPSLQLKNVFSSSAKALSIKDTTGLDRFYVSGNGKLFSNDSGYFKNGVRWSTSNSNYNDRGVFNGTGSPEGVVDAGPGSIYTNNSGGTSITIYIKENGVSNTGWVAVNGIKSGKKSIRPKGIQTGYQYFDTTLNKPIWFNGKVWVDATGKSV